MGGCAVASSSELAARAGADVAAAGGNAVDAAIAAVLVSCITEPGISSPLGGGYLTIMPPSGPAETIDGQVAVPGMGLPLSARGGGVFDLHTEYGGGVDITIGYGSAAVPGTIAALELASKRYGAVPWAALLAPSIEIARSGFELGSASTYYLRYVHLDLFGWHPVSFAALHDADGRLIPEGGTVIVPGLAETLETLARDGATALHDGPVGRAMVAEIRDGGGLVTEADLRAYEPIVRRAQPVRFGGWNLATNPPPAIGGTTLSAMLQLLDRPHGLARLVDVQDAVLGHRVDVLDLAEDLDAATKALLAAIDDETWKPALMSSSTVHTSAVDDLGGACSVTVSAGYGCGAVPGGTGMWLNNSLGEPELTRRGLHAPLVGDRLPSNMAPTVGRHDDGRVLALGSPGADRITTAILQTLIHHEHGGRDLGAAIAAPRLHVQHRDGVVVGYEADLEGVIPEWWTTHEYEANAMFFGGVGAAVRGPSGSSPGMLEAHADPRRAGGTAISNDL